MRKSLLSIGCSTYDKSYPNLVSPSVDAGDIFGVLTDPEFGGYEKLKSAVLISPTKNAFEGALANILFDQDRPDVFTLYCAGHGDLTSDTFYYCVRDSDPHRLALSAIPIATILNSISECRIPQVNIIFDTCHAGGVGFDLSQLMKPASAGKPDSPSVTLLASAASDQAAYEDNDHGVATAGLLAYLIGSKTAQATRPFLDLVEVGRLLSSDISSSGRNQTAMVWGLNLRGVSLFSRNPAYKGPVKPDGIADAVRRSPALGSAYQERLQATYLALPSEARPTGLLNVLTEIRDTNEDIQALFEGLSVSFTSRADESIDKFLSVQIPAVFVAALMTKGELNQETRRLRDLLVGDLAQRLDSAIEALLQQLHSDNRALLSDPGGLSDLFVLPLRVSMILGWAALQFLMSSSKKDPADAARFVEITRVIIEQYGDSIVCVSEEQTPYLLVYFVAAAQLTSSDEAEGVFGRLYLSYVERNGRLLSVEANGGDVFEYLRVLGGNELTGKEPYLARPSTMLPVLLWAAVALRLEDTVDPSLAKLDHHSVNVFLPSDGANFGAKTIERGTNLSLHVGHDFWRSAEFIQLIRSRFDAIASADPSVIDQSNQLACAIISFVMPDRCCWSLALADGASVI